MPDLGHEWTDEQITILEERIHEVFSQAAREMQEKNRQILIEYTKQNAEWKKRIKEKPELTGQYKAWLKEQAARSSVMNATTSRLLTDVMHAEEKAADLINDTLPRVFAENTNYEMYNVEQGLNINTTFSLYDEDTVRVLIKNTPDLLPVVRIDGQKSLLWNSQKLTSAITQGILQGEPIEAIAKRLMQVTMMDEKAAVRAARTACTGAENAGREESYRRALRMGIKLRKEWVATLDMRTRDSHRALDGERQDVTAKYSNGCRFPGDPRGAAEEVMNCRCTEVSVLEGYDFNDAVRHADFPECMTYEEWKKGKQPQQPNEKTKEPQGFVYDDDKNVIDPSAQIWQKADDSRTTTKGSEYIKHVDETTRKVWQKYEHELQLSDPVYKDGAHYTWDDGVYMNVDKDTYTEKRGILSTWFHEFGHNIDRLSIGKNVEGNYKSSSVEYRTKENKTFGDVIRGEVSKKVENRRNDFEKLMDKTLDITSEKDIDRAIKFLKKYQIVDDSSLDWYKSEIAHIGDANWFEEEGYLPWAVKTKDGQIKEIAKLIVNSASESKNIDTAVYNLLANEIDEMTDRKKHSLSDIFEGATLGNVRDTWGHGKTYFSEDGRLEREAFAEFYSAECIYYETPETLNVLKEWLPESYACYRDILKGLL